MGDLGELLDADFGAETLDLVVAGVNAEDGGGVFGDGVFVIVGVGFVCGAYLDELCAAKGHDVGQAE